jgi:transposase-like protein
MMTEDTMTRLLDQIQASTDGDFLRAIAAHTLQRLMEFEVDSLIGAGRHERSDERTTYRNGYRDRQLETRLGTLDLKIPKLRQGTYFPAFLEPRKTAEKALTAVIQEAWIQGVSTRKVDDLVQALGISPSRRSRRCARTSTRACCLSSSGRWTASGPTSGSMRPTSRSARMAASCRSPP